MDEINILSLFTNEELTEKGDENFKTICPDCGLQGGRTEGFILFPETNMAYCHSSHKNFNLLETYALKKKIIRCIDGRGTGEKGYTLHGEQFTEALDLLKEEYDEEVYEKFQSLLGLQRSIELPNNGKLISTFANELGKRVQGENIFFYRSDSRQIVEIGKIRHPDGKFIDSGFIEINPNRFITLIERYFKPWQTVYTKRGELTVTKSMSQTIANTVLVSDNFRNKMPVINRIFTVQLPVIYEGCLTFPKEGYDDRFGSWLPYNAPRISKPKMNIKDAVKLLNKIYKDFCFKSQQDYINSVAGLLTPALKGLYSEFNVRDPIFFYRGNRERVGKDYNANITGIVYEGQALEEPPISNNERGGSSNDEVRKKIMAALIQGRKRFHSSNNKGLINNAVLEGITTSRTHSDRILGKNEILTFDNEINFSLSGNIGTTLTPDLANRSIFINLFYDKEDVNARIFDTPDLHGWIKNNRELILSAIYSLIRNWVDKGCPKGSLAFASFPEWAAICGGIMESANIGNPCQKSDKDLGVASDSETEEMKILFEMCFEKMGSIWLKKSDIKNIMIESEEAIFSYIDWNKMPDQVKFAKKVGKFVGRILSDIKFVCKDDGVRASRREYKFVKEISDFVKNDHKSLHNQDKLVRLVRPGKVKTSPEIPIHIRKLKKGSYPTNPTNPTKQKSDRELQFYEDPICKNIKPNHTKKDILKWIKENSKKNYKQMYDKFGVGSINFKNKLIKEKKIKQEKGLESIE